MKNNFRCCGRYAILHVVREIWRLDENLATKNLKELCFWSSAIPFVIWKFCVANVDSLARRDTSPVVSDDTTTSLWCPEGLGTCVSI